ncbi:hypothetical protein ACLOJK_016831 [Asimina triloba]
MYVLWPECGWQPVSLTDLITGASVKKYYRKATLCIHPDKVQQKGATLQQKYIAEKVFDLLKVGCNFVRLMRLEHDPGSLEQVKFGGALLKTIYVALWMTLAIAYIEKGK